MSKRSGHVHVWDCVWYRCDGLGVTLWSVTGCYLSGSPPPPRRAIPSSDAPPLHTQKACKVCYDSFLRSNLHIENGAAKSDQHTENGWVNYFTHHKASNLSLSGSALNMHIHSWQTKNWTVSNQTCRVRRMHGKNFRTAAIIAKNTEA